LYRQDLKGEKNMKQGQKVVGWFLLMALAIVSPLWSGTTGKIAGTVIDKTTGDPLPGVNVIVDGTAFGNVTDLNGNYSILFVPPGIYDVTVSMIGYRKTTISNVRVMIDLTAPVNVSLEMATLEGEAVTVVADKNIIKKDMATSMVAVSAKEVQDLPVSNVDNVVAMQAGIQGGMQIRGGMADQSMFMMDGIVLRDPRNNMPVSSVPLSSVKEISVERGGFNAEYGQVQSGIVNVVSKEGDKTAYFGNVEFKYGPPQKKYFDISPYDRNSFWLKPYLDDAVCWTGTASGAWSKYEQLQYWSFKGWNAVSQDLMTDNDPTNDLTPMQAQRVFEWETRRQAPNNQPDYDIDAGFGGPIPLVGKDLGNLRFFTAYRRHREMLLIPLTRDNYTDYDWTMKLTSDITPSMKLVISGLIGKQYTMQQNWTYNYLRNPWEIAGIIADRSGEVFGSGNFSLSDIGHKDFSAKLTNMISQKTYYEISIDHFMSDYWTRPPATRNETTQYEILPGYYVDEAPFGYDPTTKMGIVGMFFGGHVCKRRDNSQISSTTFKADYTSQVNFNNLIKGGVEFVYNDLDLDYGIITSGSANTYDEHVQMNVKPFRGAAYLQDKMEAKGFIMNAGLRLDYSNSNTDWWNVNMYDPTFFTTRYNGALAFPTVQSKGQWQLSPRLGISHPITETSKLFFNYGHFKEMPSYQQMFYVGRASTHQMTNFGDPNLILAKTISYELGYDQTLFNTLLLQLAAFYRDIADQQNTTTITSIGNAVYGQMTSNGYGDIRGFELTLRKNQGRWWTFFGNYTYQVSTNGNFGHLNLYEDPSLQQKYNQNTTNLYQNRPIPAPYARLNVSLFTPDDYGPRFGGVYPLGGYLMNILMDWQAGPWTTWNPKSLASVSFNVQQTDHFNVVMRLAKTVHLKGLQIQGFVDIGNLLNRREMSLVNFGGTSNDRNEYFESLHLPASTAYDNITGNDRVGDYRKIGVDYQPMLWRGKINFNTDAGDEGVIYYDKTTSRYVEYSTNGGWQDVSQAKLDQVNKDKAYIDMPDITSFTFLNPRQIFFGLRVSFDIK
jgi:outer membrane receptor protein involved in Fe transport